MKRRLNLIAVVIGLAAMSTCVVASAHNGGGHGGGHWGGGGHSFGGGHWGGGGHWHGGWHGGYYGYGGVVGTPWGWPYDYGLYDYAYGPPLGAYSPPSVLAAPPLDVAPQVPSGAYFCPGENGYYPYVRECPGGWQRVNPQPLR